MPGNQLAALTGCGAAYDPGGNVAAVSEAMFAARCDERPVEIRGACYSACALKLGSGKGVLRRPECYDRRA